MTAGPTGQRPTTAGHHAHHSRPPRTHNQTSREYFKHSTGTRIYTEAVIVDSLRAEYPELHLTVVPVWGCDLLGYAAAGHASVAPIDNEKDRLTRTHFFPPATRLSGSRGALGEAIKFRKYLYDYNGKEYVVYVIEGNDGPDFFSHTYNQYVLSPFVEATNNLLFEAGVWSNELHNEVWVFDG